MKKKAVDYETVRRIGLALPGAEAGTSFGAMALKANGKMFACTPTNKAAEPNSLLLRCDIERREEMMAADPETYYTPEHYLGYPSVLVRLARLDEAMLRDLLAMAHRYVMSAQKPLKKKKA